MCPMLQTQTLLRRVNYRCSVILVTTCVTSREVVKDESGQSYKAITEGVSQAVQPEWDGAGIYLTGIDCDSDTGSETVKGRTVM
jgi:hypothetical protein